MDPPSIDFSMAKANVYEVTHEEHVAGRIVEDWDLNNLLWSEHLQQLPNITLLINLY
jgi:hypothetical protein